MIHKLSNKGMSLIELLVVLGIMSIVIAAGITIFNQQIKSTNYLEFTTKREQLRLVLLGQFLSDHNNCRCLEGTEISAGTLQGSKSTPEKIEIFTQDTCNLTTPPVQLANKEGIDGLKTSKITLKDVIAVGEKRFSGVFEMALSSTKPVQQIISLSAAPVARAMLMKSTRPFGSRLTFRPTHAR